MDRADSFNAFRSSFAEITAAMYDSGARSSIIFMVLAAAMSGSAISKGLWALARIAESGKVDQRLNYLGVREYEVKTVAHLRELSKEDLFLSSGHRMCAGCIAPVVVRMMSMAAAGRNVVVGNATGCLEVATTIYPYTAWKCSWVHNAFENAAATISGVEAAYKALRRKGKVKDDYKFIAFGGDGGTYDIGLQSLSGAMERGHDMVYVCYDNGAYMNTGIQRSGATPKFADTTTSPAGKVVWGNPVAWT